MGTPKLSQPLKIHHQVPECVHPQRVRFASTERGVRSLGLKSGRMRGASMTIALCFAGMAACTVHPGAGLGGVHIARNSLQQPRTLRLKGGGLPFGLGAAKDIRDYKTVIEESQARLPVAARGAAPSQRRSPRFRILFSTARETTKASVRRAPFPEKMALVFWGKMSLWVSSRWGAHAQSLI